MKLFIVSWFVSTVTLLAVDYMWSRFSDKIDRLFNDKFEGW